MKFADHPITRRGWIWRSTALLASGGALGDHARAVTFDNAPSGDGRFAAIDQAALPVRRPSGVVMAAAAVAGRSVVAVGERGVVLRSTDEGRTWLQAEHVPTSVTLTAVRFTDARNGWAVGHLGVVMSTRDGGVRWKRASDGRQLAHVAQAAADARAAAGDARAAALQKEAALMVRDGPDKPLLDILAIDANRVVVVGAYNLCFESTDAGATWTSWLDRLDNPKGHHHYAIASRGNTWMIAGEQGMLQLSRDGGITFRAKKSPYAGSWFAVTTPRPGTWILAGLRGNAWISRDDGDQWARLEGPAMSSFVSAISMEDGRALLATQGGQVFLASDSLALRSLKVPNLPPLAQMLPLSGGAGLSVGMGGVHRIEGGLA